MTQGSTGSGCSDDRMPSGLHHDPGCLGNFLDLLGRREAPGQALNSRRITNIVSASKLESFDMEQMLSIAARSTDFSRMAWFEARHGGVHSRYGYLPETGTLLETRLQNIQDGSETRASPFGSIQLLEVRIAEEVAELCTDDWLITQDLRSLDAMLSNVVQKAW